MVWNLVTDESHKKTWLDNRTKTIVSVETYRPSMRRGRGVDHWSYRVSALRQDHGGDDLVADTPESAVGKLKRLMMEHGRSIPPKLDMFDIPAPVALMKAKPKEQKAKVVGVDVIAKATANAYKIAGGKRKLRFEKV